MSPSGEASHWLVAGLGNPGAKYAKHRHNIGFMVLDALARDASMPAWSSKFSGEVTSGLVAGEKVHLVKPQEFMNLSGFAIQRAAQFHKIAPEHILVVHDEIDLPFGSVRLKSGGGHGGHNGLRSIIEQLGAAFARLRMGVGRDPKAPPGAKEAAGWVLADFPAAQTAHVDEMLKAACEDIATVVTKGITAAMNAHNGRSVIGSS
jgi:PTH1 family peptidyl-tRNA hydrolase